MDPELPPVVDPQQVAALQQAFIAAQQQIQQLQAQIQQLMAAAAVAAAAEQPQPQPAPVAVAPPALKPPKPTFFAGASKEKSGLEDWLFKIQTQFNALHAQPEDQHKINYVASYFTGTALKWWRLNAVTFTQPGVTYQAFTQALVTAFAAPNAQQKAREKMDSLRQNGSVAQYTSRFRELLLEIPSMQPAEALHRFVTGLKPTVKQHVLIAKPATVDDAIALADRVDQAAFDTRAPFPPRRRPVNGTVFAGGPVPMEIGAMQPMPGRPRPKLTPEQREYLRQNNGCFYCRRLGHTTQSCSLLARTQRPGQRAPMYPGNAVRRSN